MDNLTKSYLVLAAAGIVVAIYHAQDELTQIFTSCNINSKISCGSVFQSGYTAIFGVQFYMLGLVWFPFLLVLGIWLAHRGEGHIRGEVMVPILMVGNIFTVYFWYLEFALIGAICPVCVVLYVINYVMTALCIVAALRD